MIERKSKGRAMNNWKGFALVEAVIVICIIAIVVAIAIPPFRKMGINEDLKAAARDMISDFSYIRQRAISENQNYSIAFDRVNNNYTVPGVANPKTPANFERDIIISGTSFGATLTFQTRGTTSPPGGKTITLTNGLGSTATITIGTVGRIYVAYAFN